jgi:DNA-binding response OmpR family regulator
MAATATPSSDAGTGHDGADPAPSGSILLIDDDPAMATMLSLLGLDHSFTVDVATDGIEGLDRAKQSDADLIVLDLNLPRLTGLDVCRGIRAADIMVPIVMVSAHHEVVDVVVGLEMGADDYVTKPFELRELAARIGAHLRRQRRTTAQVRPGRVKFPGLVIDMGRHEVLRDGETVELTRTEFNILALLTSRPGRVVSRVEMIEQVWGREAELEPRSIDAHIYRLRRKIEPHHAYPTYLHAIPGVGYRFDCPPEAGVERYQCGDRPIQPASRS